MNETQDAQQTPEPSPDASRFERLVERDSPGSSGRETALAAVALLALVVGLPALLLALAGPPPIPTSLPPVQELARQISADDLVSVLVAIVWLVWLFFVVCVVAEVVAARRGGLGRTIPLGGPVQKLARVLVGALLLSGIVAGPAQAAAGPADMPAQSVGISAAQLDTDVLQEAAAEIVAEEAAEAVGDEGKKIYTVKAPDNGYHDNLWDIAENHLGDGRRYAEIFELNKDRVQSDGRTIELARLIQPGWELQMPDDAVGIERVAAPAPAVPSVPGTPDGSADAGASADLEAAESQSGAVGDWGAGAGLAAAVVLGGLMLHRRRALGRGPDEDALEVEGQMRTSAATARLEAVDAVLRRLARQARHSGTTPPPLHAVHVDDTSVELHLSPNVPVPMEGWTSLDDGARWRHEFSSPPEPVTGEVFPYPALVSLGIDVEGRDVLLDLEAAGGVVAIGGPADVAAQVAQAIAVHAALAPWSEAARVVASGLPESLSTLGEGRLRAVDDLGPELDELESALEGLRTDVLVGRMGRRGASGQSHIVINGTALEPDVAERLGNLVGGGRQALSVVVTGDHPAARWRIRADENAALELPALGLSVEGNRLTSRQVDAVVELFDAAAQDEHPDPDGRVQISADVRSVDDAAWEAATARVGVLGPLVVESDGRVDQRRLDQAAEIVAFLALHPEGAHPEVLTGAIWPRGVTEDVRDAAVERARAWLGTDRDGTHLLRADVDGRLSLADSVVCDWHAVCTLVTQARTASVDEEKVLLRRALELVRGEPFERLPQGRYGWVAQSDLPRLVLRSIVQVSERLARLDGDDPGGVGAAAEAGLRAAPGLQSLWRSVLRSRYAIDGVAGVQRTLEEMGEALESMPLEPETEALIEELLPAAGGSAAGA